MGRLDAWDGPSSWQDTVDAELALSDRLLRAGDREGALTWFDKALRIAYHPALHYGEQPSPLGADPDAFLAPFRDAAIGRALLRPPVADPGPRRIPARERTPGEPFRLLVLAQRNWTFVAPLIRALEERGFEVRRFEVDDLPPADRPTREHVLRARLDLALDGRRIPTPPALLEQFAWADAVLVEWGHHVLTWMSMLETMPRRTAARFHRFEVYTPFPLLTVFSAIDLVLFVSPHVRTMLGRLTENLGTAGEVRLVDNLLVHGLGEDPEKPGDPHLLAQVGWSREIKDVLFTLDMLERLRAEDDRFRLILVGAGLPADPAQDTSYLRRVRERLARLPAGAVEQLGVRDDVPAVLADAGWIVSSSFDEGVHEAVMEGLAAGCLPVIRDWPRARPYGGASVIYERSWIVEDVDGAVDRVRTVVASGEADRLSAESRAWVVRRRTPDTVAEGYIAALTGEQSPS